MWPGVVPGVAGGMDAMQHTGMPVNMGSAPPMSTMPPMMPQMSPMGMGAFGMGAFHPTMAGFPQMSFMAMGQSIPGMSTGAPPPPPMGAAPGMTGPGMTVPGMTAPGVTAPGMAAWGNGQYGMTGMGSMGNMAAMPGMEAMMASMAPMGGASSDAAGMMAGMTSMASASSDATGGKKRKKKERDAAAEEAMDLMLGGPPAQKRTKEEKKQAKKAATDILMALQGSQGGGAPPDAPPAGGADGGSGEASDMWAAAAAAQQQQYLQQYQFHQQIEQQNKQANEKHKAEAVSEATSRFKDNFRPMRICKHLITFGICRQGQECTFGHTYDELHPASPDCPQAPEAETSALSQQGEVPESSVPDMRLKKKKEMCGRFSRGECSLGKICPFAHSEDQLGTVGLAVCGKVKTRLCLFWDEKTQLAKGCIYGKNCNNAHGEWEIGMKRPPPELAPPMNRRKEGGSVIAGRQ